MAEVSGKFYNLTIEEKPAAHALDRDLGRRVWRVSEELTGLPEMEIFEAMSLKFTPSGARSMKYDVIIVGGGIAGLTAAAFLSKAGIPNLLIEKQPHVGGLVNTFERDGFFFDGGIRATENSGVLFPMLKALGLDVDFVKNNITLGIEDRILPVQSEDDVSAYRDLLADLYPESTGEIDDIVAQMRRIMKYMEIQYGIDNPVFLDVKTDRDYFIRKVFPWMFQYAFTFKKVEALNIPVLDFLRRYTDNQSLLDIIAQHFFAETPAFFALSYMKLYLDYYYPKGGTGVLIDALAGFTREHGGEIRTDTVDHIRGPGAQDRDRRRGQRLRVRAVDLGRGPQNALQRTGPGRNDGRQSENRHQRTGSGARRYAGQRFDPDRLPYRGPAPFILQRDRQRARLLHPEAYRAKRGRAAAAGRGQGRRQRPGWRTSSP